MNKKYKALYVAALAVPMLMTTGCIEEVLPTNGIVQSQLEGSSKATEALVWAMPAHFNTVGTVATDLNYDWGEGSLLCIRDAMTEDVVRTQSGYNWYSAWSTVSDLGEQMIYGQFIWNYYWAQIVTANKVIEAIDPATTNTDQLAQLGAGLCFRAYSYLDMARWYEFLPNNYVSAVNNYNNDVTGYTVPILTEKTTEAEARNNPRATHDKMVEFIRTDLENAVKAFKSGSARTSKSIPDLYVAYGLLARLYLWDATYHEEGLPHAGSGTAAELYAKAADYARLAIGNSTPMTQEEWLSTTSGFNTMAPSSWMWGIQNMAEDRTVTSGILNWTSWQSNETTFGYAQAGAYLSIYSYTYRRINDRDFRKLAFMAPQGSVLAGREPVIDKEFAADKLGEYFSLKFRPVDGNMGESKVAACSAVPLMRVEEMYFIEAEARAHINPAEGKQKLEDFMKTYRYATYKTEATSVEDVVEEIIFQKRIELWGEGRTFYDIKRLNYSVDRAKAGSNFTKGADMYVTNGRPAWMNCVIVRTEGNNNEAVLKWNNPDPSGALKPVS